MALDLSGLGGALGAAAGGYLTGKNRGEAEAYRRQLLEADREQKRAALAAQAEARRQSLAMQQQGLDLRREGLGLQREGLALRGKPRPVDADQKARDLVGQIYLKNLEQRRNLENQGFFNDPRNEPIARQYDMANEHAAGIATGIIPLSDLNWQLLSFAAGGPPSPGPVSVAPPSEPFVVDLGGGRAVMPPDFPVQQPGSGGLGDTFVPSAPGDTPRQFVTEKQRQADERLDLQGRGVGVRERALELNTPYLKGRGAIAGADAATRPAMNQARLKDLGAGTELKGAQTRQITTLLPGKKKQTEATAKKTTEETKAIPRRLTQADERLAEQKRAAKERERQNRQNATDLKAYRGVLIDKAKKALATKGSTEEAKLLQQRVNTNLRIITATKRGAMGGGDEEQFSQPRRQKAQAEMEADLTRLTEIRRGETAKATKSSLGGGSGGADQITEAELKHVRGIGKAGFKGWVAGLPPAAQARAKKAAGILGWR